MTSIRFDRDQDPALDRRGLAADQAIGVLCSVNGRRLVKPPYDRRDRPPLGLRQARESRRALGRKAADGETLEVEDFRQSGRVGHSANHAALEERHGQPLQLRFETPNFASQLIGARGFRPRGKVVRGAADQQALC